MVEAKPWRKTTPPWSSAWSKPFNALLYTLAVVGIVPEHAYGEGYGANPVGSGRYMLEQWDQGPAGHPQGQPRLLRREAPKIERVVAVFMEEDASLAAAQSGQVDVAYTSATPSPRSSRPATTC